MSKNLMQSIEAILFATSEPQSFASLANRLNVTKDDIKNSVDLLQDSFSDHGIMLVTDGDSATLATKPEQNELIENIRKEELNKELSKASSETLAIIAYHPGVTKTEIEFIRGVNSAYSLRALQIRGLIEQKSVARSSNYFLTLEALRHFGIQKVEDLPNYAETKSKIEGLMSQQKQEATTE